ncbi:gamma-glutamyl-gamma-aminobutyrate hydrolase family protein [Pseudomonas sp. UBA1879]|uniref:gamma-glutamyl-gamma-aminobutyrate hydrolase family protein n=1 Tax=Pseudomonas sp. UBA1879 TaxID=1947305 RepID=UPI0025DDBA19|nr:gamma-glutamyl-gamma-aminobutyrate hydrolase family protein [Pseudomonas sp. UBA1879]
MKKIGITLRQSSPSGYHEPRDSLARDWYCFFDALGAGHHWLLLPNLGEQTVAYAQRQGVEAVIFSGGDDIGSDPVRDVTEQALLSHCIAERWPVLGVCRGLQLIQLQFGGQLTDANRALHVAQRHRLIPAPESLVLPWHDDRQPRMVNSFHGNRLADPVPEPLQVWARDEQGACEALVHGSEKIAGIMWHPEREATLSEPDRQLCRWLFE